jgi:hypothetical protein
MVLVFQEDAMTGPVEQSHTCSHSHEHDHDSHQHHDCAGHDHADSTPVTISTSLNHLPEEPFSRVVGFMDIAGVFASGLCTVHCLVIPILVIAMPMFASHMMHDDYVHVGLAGFVLTFCLMAYVPGYLKHHDKRLIWLGVCGITLVFFATFVARQWGEFVEASIITAGNVFIIMGHLLNRKLLAHLKCKHHK